MKTLLNISCRDLLSEYSITYATAHKLLRAIAIKRECKPRFSTRPPYQVVNYYEYTVKVEDYKDLCDSLEKKRKIKEVSSDL